MKILITGGCGFVGGTLARYFAGKGHEVVAFDNLARRGSEINLKHYKKLGVRFTHGDIRNNEDFDRLERDFDVLLEAAAQTTAVDGYANPRYDMTNNFLGVLNCLEYCRATGAGLVLWSTNKAFSSEHVNAFPLKETDTRWEWDADKCEPTTGFDPVHGFAEDFTIDGKDHSIYGLSKICAGLMVREWSTAFGVKACTNRFSCLAGPNQFGHATQGWVIYWALATHFGWPVEYLGWDGKQVRDVLFSEDLCALVESEIENLDKISGEAFNIGGGSECTLSLREATAFFEKRFSKKLDVSVSPTPRRADHVIYVSDIRKAEKLLGWKPRVKLEDGLDGLASWVEENQSFLEELYS